MEYLLCIPSGETNTRENCEKIHNVLARMSDTYKLRIVPEPVKNKQFPCPPYYKKYRIYKQVKERDTNGEAYLEKEEEDMILSSCKTEEEQELMKSCIFAYQYPASLVLKSFREKEKKNKVPNRMIAEKNQDSGEDDDASGTVLSEKPNKEAKEKNERRARERDTREKDIRERDAREKESREKAIRDRDAREIQEKSVRVRERDIKERENRDKGVRERDTRTKFNRERGPQDRSRKVREPREKNIQRNASPIVRTNDVVDNNSSEFRTHAETGSVPTFREKMQLVISQPSQAQPLQRKKDNYTPLERKPALQSQSHEA